MLQFPEDIEWPPAAEMDYDFAGKGYGRSLFGSVAARLGGLASGFPQVPGKGKRKIPYTPRIMLYLVYYSKIVEASRLLEHWQQVAQYLHTFFFVADASNVTFCYFGAKRALDYIVGNVQCVPLPSINYKQKFGLDITGCIGSGAVATVDKADGGKRHRIQNDVRGYVQQPNSTGQEA